MQPLGASLHGCMQCISSISSWCVCHPFLSALPPLQASFHNPCQPKFSQDHGRQVDKQAAWTPQTAGCGLLRPCAWHDAALTKTVQLWRQLSHPGTNPRVPLRQARQTCFGLHVQMGHTLALPGHMLALDKCRTAALHAPSQVHRHVHVPDLGACLNHALGVVLAPF